VNTAVIRDRARAAGLKDAIPDRTVRCLPAVELVLLVDPFGELVAQNMAGRVEFVRYADGRALQRSETGKRYWHKRATDEQLAAVQAEFERAAALGKPYANDWTPTPPPPWWHPLDPERPCTASTSLPTPPPPCPSDTPPTPLPS